MNLTGSQPQSDACVTWEWRKGPEGCGEKWTLHTQRRGSYEETLARELDILTQFPFTQFFFVTGLSRLAGFIHL